MTNFSAQFLGGGLRHPGVAGLWSEPLAVSALSLDFPAREKSSGLQTSGSAFSSSEI